MPVCSIAAERRDVMRSVMRRAEELSCERLAALCDELASRAGGAVSRRWWAHARYVGQGHELDVPATPADDGATIAMRFAALHEARAGFTLDRPVEVVSLRHAAFGAARDARLTSTVPRGSTPLVGHAIVALGDATMRVEEGWTATALPGGGWMLERV
jgi:N-methylhydantoinase A